MSIVLCLAMLGDALGKVEKKMLRDWDASLFLAYAFCFVDTCRSLLCQLTTGLACAKKAIDYTQHMRMGPFATRVYAATGGSHEAGVSPPAERGGEISVYGSAVACHLRPDPRAST